MSDGKTEDYREFIPTIVAFLADPLNRGHFPNRIHDAALALKNSTYSEFRELLRLLRVANGMTSHGDMARLLHTCGIEVTENIMERWEGGLSIPGDPRVVHVYTALAHVLYNETDEETALRLIHEIPSRFDEEKSAWQTRARDGTQEDTRMADVFIPIIAGFFPPERERDANALRALRENHSLTRGGRLELLREAGMMNEAYLSQIFYACRLNASAVAITRWEQRNTLPRSPAIEQAYIAFARVLFDGEDEQVVSRIVNDIHNSFEEGRRTGRKSAGNRAHDITPTGAGEIEGKENRWQGKVKTEKGPRLFP